MAHVALKELRTFWGTTFNTTHTAPNDAAWNTTNTTKLRVISIDESGLVSPGIPDETIQTRLHGTPAPFPGLRKGTLKFSTYLTGGNGVSTQITGDAITNMIGYAMGNVTTMTGKQYVIQSTGTSTSNVVMNGINASMVVGQGILFPSTKEARIASTIGENHVTLNMVLNDTPTGNAVIGHTCYFDETAVLPSSNRYCDWLIVKPATDTSFQGVGAVASFTIKGTNPGEAPVLDWELQTADYQLATFSLASLAPSATPRGGDPPTGKYQGGVFMQNIGSTVRNEFGAGDIVINPNIKWSERRDLFGVNGIYRWWREPGSPTLEMTIAQWTKVAPVYNFDDKVAKHIMIQFGSGPGACVMIHYPKFFLDDSTTSKPLGNESGFQVKGHGDDNYTAGNECASSAMTISIF